MSMAQLRQRRWPQALCTASSSKWLQFGQTYFSQTSGGLTILLFPSSKSTGIFFGLICRLLSLAGLVVSEPLTSSIVVLSNSYASNVHYKAEGVTFQLLHSVTGLSQGLSRYVVFTNRAICDVDSIVVLIGISHVSAAVCICDLNYNSCLVLVCIQ